MFCLELQLGQVCLPFRLCVCARDDRVAQLVSTTSGMECRWRLLHPRYDCHCLSIQLLCSLQHLQSGVRPQRRRLLHEWLSERQYVVGCRRQRRQSVDNHAMGRYNGLRLVRCRDAGAARQHGWRLRDCPRLDRHSAPLQQRLSAVRRVFADDSFGLPHLHFEGAH